MGARAGNMGPYIGHRAVQVPYCPRCKGRKVCLASNEVTPETSKFPERVTAACLSCRHEWLSENGVLVKEAKEANAKC